MDVVRRVYLYVIAAASLGMLVVGLCNLGASLVDLASGSAVERSVRESVATAGALILVGLPIWAFHWTIANRAARSNSADRGSALRRLYLYGTAGALLIAFATLGSLVLEQLLNALARTEARWDGIATLRHLWQAGVAAAFWGYQLRCAATDRAEAGETGASATLRRWYAYLVQFAALLTLLFASRELLRSIALYLIDRDQFVREATTLATIARLLIALVIWVIHQRWTAGGKVGADDRPSTLRAVYGFVVLGLSVCLTLVDTSQVLYYALARALGVARPGGIEGDITRALVNPATTIVVFGIAWALMRHRLARDAAEATAGGLAPEQTRQVGVRRLYTHLVSLVALGTLAAGLTGVLWTVSDRLLDVQAATPDAWRDQISLSITLIVVGLVAWLGHWRPAGAPDERLALSRRLYLFAALLAAVLGLLGSGATLVYTLLGQLIAVPGASTATMGRALAANLIAAGIGAYHWRVLHEDLAVRRAQTDAEEGLDRAQPTAESLIVEIVGASEAEVRLALAQLPEDASYSLRALDLTAGAD